MSTKRQQWHLPSIWESSHITPIHGKGNKQMCTDYRPLSLLSCVGKVLEKCVQTHVFKYLNKQMWTNYRPLTFLSCVEKVREKCVQAHVFEYLNKQRCTDYRHRLLLSCVGKVLEKCVQVHVFENLSNNRLLTPFQSSSTPRDSSVY